MKKKNFKQILLIIAALIGNQMLFAQVVKYQTPGLPESSDFMIWVNDQKVFTTKAGGDYRGSYSFANFDFNDSVKIRVKAKHAIKWLDIMPSILKIKSKTIDDYTFEFTLDKPRKITILLNNDKRNVLHLLTNSIEEKTVDPKEDNVLYYKGGKIYDIGVLDLKDNQTLYVEGGARLKGMVRIRDAKNVKILGRGIIDGTDNKSSGNGRFKDEPWRLIYIENSSNIEIKGITLYNSLKWTLHPYNVNDLHIDNINIVNWDYGSDGIDLSSCRDVKISNSFLRTNDDCIAVKAISFDKKMHYPNPRIQNPNIKNILVEGCTFWNMEYGNVFDIGFELRCEKISDLTFRNCDVLIQEGRGSVFTIHNSDNALVEDVLFEDIRVENADLASNSKLIDISILFSIWSYDKFEDSEMIKKYRYNDSWDNLIPVLPGKEAFHASHRGHVKNITLRNIQVLDGKLPYSVFNGFDKDHIIEGVVIENMTVSGKKIKTKEDLKLYTKFTKNIIIE
tara:strand:- start:1530 stop:3047 length:1518 start_codon:yes stop_codon:yes gene_type:complete